MPNFEYESVFGFKPTFTAEQFDRFARNRQGHATSIYHCALEALARVAEGGPLIRTEANFDLLAHSTKVLAALYVTACQDPRNDERVTASYLDDLYWWVIGAASRYVAREHGECWIEWEWWIKCAGRLKAVLVDIVGSGYVAGDELRDKIVTLEALAFSAAALHEWFGEIKVALEPDIEDEFVIHRDADQLARSLFDAVKQLRLRFGIEPHAAPWS